MSRKRSGAYAVTCFAYRNESAQEFRFVISEQIRQQIFYASLLQNIESKSIETMDSATMLSFV